MPPFRSHRALIMGRNGAVGANHPLATQAGLDVLRAGGNAFDAAVAISLALGVVEPMMSGLGGDGFYHVHIAATGEALVYNGTGPAPRAATPEAFADGIEVHGPRSVSVPASLAGLATMHAAHGSLPWAGLATAAIAYARDGFAVTHGYLHFARDNRPQLDADPRSRATFLRDGEPALGDIITQPALAATLEEVARGGAEAFYRGPLARRLARGLSEAGTLITAEDLAAVRAEVVAPIAVAYRGYEVRQVPPNSIGFVFLQMLRIVERFEIAAMPPDARIHILVEAKKRAFLSYEQYGSDPRFQDVPVPDLLSDAVIDAHAAAIDPDHAADLPLVSGAPADTTYFCVIDREGNAISAIQSINSAFGSGVTAGDTGILLNNRMAYWHLAEGHANRLAPGKRVRHTMNAPMVFKDGKLWAVLGTPGGDNQIQVNLQVLTDMIDLGHDPQAAIEQARWTHSQVGQAANWPHEGDGRLTVEPGFGADVLAALERRGHVLNRVGPLEAACSMQAIRLLDNGVRMAGSDPRRDGWAGAY